MKLYHLLIPLALIVSATAYAASPVSLISPISPEINKKIQTAIDTSRTANDVPGMQVTVSLSGEGETYDYFSGTRSLNDTTPVGRKDLFQIGSNTKAFIAVILLQLEAEGKLSIDDPIGKYLANEFKQNKWPDSWKNITIKQLLNMTSGIYNYSEKKGFLNDLPKNPAHIYSPVDLINIAAKQPNYFKPGGGWHYSNTDYILAGMIIEKVTKKTVKKNLEHRIFIPLKLKNTYYSPRHFSKEVKNRTVNGYWARRDGKKNITAITDTSNVNTSWAGAAGAIRSNTRDMIFWIRTLFGKNKVQILKEEQREELMTLVCTPGTNVKCQSPHTPPGTPPKPPPTPPGTPSTPESGGYGLGVSEVFSPYNGEIWLYTGETIGFQFQTLWVPKYDLVISLTGSLATATPYAQTLAIDILNILVPPPPGFDITAKVKALPRTHPMFSK